MSARIVATTVAMLVSTSALAAEPPKAPAKDAAQQPSRPAQVMLASADKLPTPAQSADQQAPIKKRVARVTACRCGDQIAEQPEQ